MIYYIKANLWQHIDVIQPIEAESEDEAVKTFTTALEGKARDLQIEEVILTEERLKEVLIGDDDPNHTVH